MVAPAEEDDARQHPGEDQADDRQPAAKCASRHDAPGASRVIGLSATPSSMPAKIRNRVAAKVQVKQQQRGENSTTPMPPTEMAHAKLLRGLKAYRQPVLSH